MNKRVWIGLVFLIFGFGFLLQQSGFFDFSSVLATWWPLIFIVIGVIQLAYRKHGTVLPGLLFIMVGGLLLVNQWVDVNLAKLLFPLILIFIGCIFLFTRFNREKSPHTEQDINTFALFSGSEVRSQSKDFKGGSVGTLFGGAEIDLRDVTLSEKGASLELSAIFGGIEVKVPTNIRVELKGLPILGGIENKTRPYTKDNEDLPVLKVNCLAVFGGVEIRD